MNDSEAKELLMRPWAILPAHASLVASALLNGIPEGVSARKRPATSSKSGDASIISIHGPLFHRENEETQWYGFPTYEQIERDFDAAAADSKTQAIILDIDSPGGMCYGLDELAARIHAVSKSKKVIAVAAGLIASAAYYIGSQANELVISPSTECGCIGTICIHVDLSQAYEKMGVKLKVFKSDEKKGAGNPYEPLDETGRAEYQKCVEDFHDQFVHAVARGRNVTLTKVREDFGRGGVFRASDAVKFGLADRIGTLAGVVARFRSTSPSGPQYSADFLRRRLMLRP